MTDHSDTSQLSNSKRESSNRLSPQRLGFACGVCSLLLGLIYLGVAGAPRQYLAINVAAFTLGIAGVLLGSLLRWVSSVLITLGIPLIALVLVVTAVVGPEFSGASRWLSLGRLSVQPSFVFLPLIVVSFARAPSAVTLAAILFAALGLALQPDRGMAGALVFALSAHTVLNPNRQVFIALAAAIAAFAATLLQPDTLPAMPYVEDVVFNAFSVSLGIGVAVVCGLVLLVVPGFAGVWQQGTDRRVCFLFAATWFAVIAAALIGNYPTPVVGYSGAAVLGYVLSVGSLPSAVAPDASKVFS
ncbi:MAG: hypothetical protein AAGC71_14915 [Pseudomonadota bacterium]